MADISKEDLRKEITAILNDVDLSDLIKKVRQELEEKLEANLQSREKEIHDLVREFVSGYTSGSKSGGRGESGYTKTLNLSPELAALVGQDAMERREVVQKVWAIIEERDLYDPKNNQYAICDDALFKVIGVKRFRTFGMMKYLKNHFIS